jgi:hypothetical protein
MLQKQKTKESSSLSSPDLRFGDIIFFGPVTSYGKVFSMVEQGPWAHVGFVLEVSEEEVLFMESEWNGVRIRVLRVDWENFEIWRPNMDPVRTKKQAYGEVGKFYDYKHLLWTGFRLLTKNRFRIPKTDNEQYICSEFVNWLYEYQFIEQGTATPNNLYEIIQKNGSLLWKKDKNVKRN